MTSTPGLRSLSQTVQQLQDEIQALNRPSPASEIQHIRQRHIAKKIDALNDQFLQSIPDGELSWMTIIIMCMEFVEEKAYRYAQLLDVAESGQFKEEIALILLRTALLRNYNDVELELNDLKQIVQTICLASKRFYQINNKPIQISPSPVLPVVKYEPDKRDSKLRRFLRRTASKPNDSNNVRPLPSV